jgi:hypothetical protein
MTAPMRRGQRGGEQLMVPRASFSSYYGRPIVKRPVWSRRDIGGYLFTGGLAAGSALVAAGADLTHRPGLRRVSRLTALAATAVSGAALVDDLGVPSRFHHMLRVAKPTSPMSVGSWLLSAFAAPMGVAALSEMPAVVPKPLRGVVNRLARPSGIAAAAVAPGVATYTAVLLSDTAVPSWHAAYPELPFIFAGSALSASAGAALLGAPISETGPVRRLAVLGAALELAASQRLEGRLGVVGEPYKEGHPGTQLKAAKALTALGAVGAALGTGRSRTVAAASGGFLLASSLLTRLAIFDAGLASTEDPKYVVVPQLDLRNSRNPQLPPA